MKLIGFKRAVHAKLPNMVVSNSLSNRRVRTLAAATGVLLVSLPLAACTSGTAVDVAEPPVQAPSSSRPTELTVVAIGDSLTAATNSCGKQARCVENSWATGDNAQVASLASRLQTTNDLPLNKANFAVTGTKLNGLGGQLRAALKRQPQYLTVLIGGNDFCTPTLSDMTETADFEREFKHLVATVHRQSPGTQLIVPSILNPMTIYEAGVKNPAARKAWRGGRVCQSLLADPSDGSDSARGRRAAVLRRAVEFNAVLAETCTAALRCKTDGGALFRVNFTAARLSKVDYFHPSVVGQHGIAEAVWTGLPR